MAAPARRRRTALTTSSRRPLAAAAGSGFGRQSAAVMSLVDGYGGASLLFQRGNGISRLDFEISGSGGTLVCSFRAWAVPVRGALASGGSKPRCCCVVVVKGRGKKRTRKHHDGNGPFFHRGTPVASWRSFGRARRKRARGCRLLETIARWVLSRLFSVGSRGIVVLTLYQSGCGLPCHCTGCGRQ